MTTRGEPKEDWKNYHRSYHQRGPIHCLWRNRWHGREAKHNTEKAGPVNVDNIERNIRLSKWLLIMISNLYIHTSFYLQVEQLSNWLLLFFLLKVYKEIQRIISIRHEPLPKQYAQQPKWVAKRSNRNPYHYKTTGH